MNQARLLQQQQQQQKWLRHEYKMALGHTHLRSIRIKEIGILQIFQLNCQWGEREQNHGHVILIA